MKFVCPEERFSEDAHVDSNSDSSTAGGQLSRRSLLKNTLALGGVAGTGALGAAAAVLTAQPARADGFGSLPGTVRESEAFERRVDAARLQRQRPLPTLPDNGDEARYAATRIGSFSKTLPHNNLGEVDPAAYDALLRALASGMGADFDAVPAGGAGKLANPRAAYAFAMDGADCHKADMPAVHAFASARQAAEAGEVYWMAVTRDVPYGLFGSHPATAEAAADMSRFSDFSGPLAGGRVTPDTLFRGLTPGDLRGPFISQFLYLDVPYGNRDNPQIARNPVRGDDYMTDYASWLAVQRGQLPPASNRLQHRPRYITTGRHLGEYVHRDYPYQAYLNAALICLGFGAEVFDPNPYSVAAREAAFITFGAGSVFDLVARAATSGLKAAWFHKWLVHRKLRPESFGGRLHNHLTGAASYPIDAEILDSPVLDRVYRRFGTYLLPQAFPEGSPTHPSYPAGHACVAGACVTVLKAIFDEGVVIPAPSVPNLAGTRLLPYSGEALTLGDELNKLASNIALGRNIAGVHWRADGDDGLVVGEEAAISLLQDTLRTLVEPGAAYQFTRFDGVSVQVTQDDIRVV